MNHTVAFLVLCVSSNLLKESFLWAAVCVCRCKEAVGLRLVIHRYQLLDTCLDLVGTEVSECFAVNVRHLGERLFSGVERNLPVLNQCCLPRPLPGKGWEGLNCDHELLYNQTGWPWARTTPRLQGSWQSMFLKVKVLPTEGKQAQAFRPV